MTTIKEFENSSIQNEEPVILESEKERVTNTIKDFEEAEKQPEFLRDLKIPEPNPPEMEISAPSIDMSDGADGGADGGGDGGE